MIARNPQPTPASPLRSAQSFNSSGSSAFLDNDDYEASHGPSSLQRFAAVLAIFASAISVVVITNYCQNQSTYDAYVGGLNWESRIKNYHPVLMVSGFLFCFLNALLVYRVLPESFVSRQSKKYLHVFFQMTAFSCITSGLVAIFLAKNSKNYNSEHSYYPNLYSIHSIVSIIALLAYFQNFFFATIFFIVPYYFDKIVNRYFSSSSSSSSSTYAYSWCPCIVSLDFQRWYSSHHILWGVWTLFMAAIAIETGIMDLSGLLDCGYEVSDGSPDTNPGESYSKLPSGCKDLNLVGILSFFAFFLAAFSLLNKNIRARRSQRSANV